MTDPLALVALIVVPLLLGLAAARWGHDSRDPRWSVSAAPDRPGSRTQRYHWNV